MNAFASEEYTESKKLISKLISEGKTWEEVALLCVSPEEFENEFYRLRDDELIIAPNMEPADWTLLVRNQKQNYSPLIDPYGISSGTDNSLPVPTDSGSAWVRYKNHLLGISDGKRKMSDAAVDSVERNSHWILNHLKRETRVGGPVKGLVMGSVQSGKTANMIGLATMAAHYDWNVVIVLSGTIENLRKQTRDRFFGDLTRSGGVLWHVLDYTGNPDYMLDIGDNSRVMTEDLKLNSFLDGQVHGGWMHRYAIVCLKNSTRLRNLIGWLHSNTPKASRMRMLVIDDEADQASVNTRKMKDVLDEEEIERTAVNQLIIDLVSGKNSDGSPSSAPFQAINYIAFTATPYANVLNEAYDSSLYPRNFICSLPESKEYFGAKAIFGSKKDEEYKGLNIIREIQPAEVNDIKNIHTGHRNTLPTEYKNAVCWFLCAAAILRTRGQKKPISMLIHTTALQFGHFEEYDILRNWLSEKRNVTSILASCRTVYEKEKTAFTFEDLRTNYPDYGLLDSVDRSFPDFDEIEGEIGLLLSSVENIMMDEDKQLSYHENGIHLCVDNYIASRAAEEGTYLRIVYPSSEQLNSMKKAPVFIVLGGNTLSRGLTLEGLVCTYFARKSNQADTLMQMARWFGYRKGYELLQRIWLSDEARKKFELLEEIDEKLKEEFEEFMKKGRSPSEFGPKVMTSAKIARFMVTAKNKSQNAEECEFDFSGDSYETTDFINDAEKLRSNINVAEEFLSKLGTPVRSEVNDNAYYWENVPSTEVVNDFIKRYTLFDCGTSLINDMPIFLDWLGKMNSEGRYLNWNVAVAGNKKAKARWKIGDADVGKTQRSKKQKENEDYIDIGSLRSGPDALCDVKRSSLSPEQVSLLDSVLISRKGIILARGKLALNDTPLLLLYRIDKDSESTAKSRVKLNSADDIIGFSIIVAGEPSGESHVTKITVKIPEKTED